jgi:hypothetical protein
MLTEIINFVTLYLGTGLGSKQCVKPLSYSLRLPSMSLIQAIQDKDISIMNNPETHGSMFVLIILGSDKITISVATGHNEYWPLYLSIKNIHNNVHWAHQNGVVLVGFLAILKSEFQSSCLQSRSIKIPQLTSHTQKTQSSKIFIISSSI